MHSYHIYVLVYYLLNIHNFFFFLDAQVEHLAAKHHIYTLLSGRANISGMVSSKIEDIARAINETITSRPFEPEKNISVLKMG